MKGGKQAGTIPPQSAEFAGPPSLSSPRDKRGKARPTDRQMPRRRLSEEDASLPVEMGSP